MGHRRRLNAYLQKPVRQSQLYDCLVTLLSANSAAPEKSRPKPSAQPAHERRAAGQGREYSPIRILIAEDNPVNQRVALGQLNSLGYKAKALPNGVELLRSLDEAEADIILMDCQMPEMDGFAATAEIRRREGNARHTTIIALTANALDGESEKCLAAGMDDYLSKPVKPEDLRRKLEHWTGVIAARSDGTDPNEFPPVLDQAQFDSLKAIRPDDSDGLVSELIELFLGEASTNLAELREREAAGEVSEIRRVAHRLKGSCSNIGAARMTAVLEQLEDLSVPAEASARLARLEIEHERIRQRLAREPLATKF